MGPFSLWVRATFFAMVTLAVASAVAILVSQLSQFMGCKDGLTYQISHVLTPAFQLGQEEVLVNYYLIFGASLLLFLVLLCIVSSPLGRVLQAICENDFRAKAISYGVVLHWVAATCLSAAGAALAGSLYAIWLRYVGPDTTPSFEIMLDILLMVVIGGRTTMYGAIVGATIEVLAQSYFQTLMTKASEATASLPLVPDLLDSDCWLLWLGLLFILSVYFFYRHRRSALVEAEPGRHWVCRGVRGLKAGFPPMT